MTRWKNRSDIERQFSPANWGYTLQEPERAYKAECPTLLQYDTLYGTGSSDIWIEAMVTGLYGASSNRDKGNADGIRIFSQSFSASVKGFKLSELMLFFARYKSGRYDNSYATFDARRIGNAFFKEFLKERNNELDVITRRESVKRIEERAYKPPEGYTSLSWYQELKRRAASGDEQAKSMLTRP